MSRAGTRRGLLQLSQNTLRSYNFLAKSTPPAPLPDVSDSPSTLPLSDTDKASPLATSSETTLDDFPYIPTSDPIVTSLNYATDSELIDAILTESPTAPEGPVQTGYTGHARNAKYARPAPPARLASGRRYVSPYDLDWKSSIDPAFAFLALRTRPTFGRFMEHIRPKVSQVYKSLRASGMHQLFASDVLIRSGDSQVIREILQLDGGYKKNLRTSAAVSMYQHIRPLLDGKKLEPLSGEANLAIARAIIAEGSKEGGDHSELMVKLFGDIYRTVEWKSDTKWEFFLAILFMARQGKVDDALSMVQRLVADGRMPQGVARQTDPSHPDAKLVLVQSIIVRASLILGFFSRVQIAADDLINTMARSEEISETMSDLVNELCRASIVGRNHDQAIWAGDFLLRYAALPGAPPIPSSLINEYIENTPRAAAVDFYLRLPANHQPPSALNIIRLAQFRARKELMTALLADVARIPESEFLAQRGAFLSALVKARDTEAVIALYEAWKSTLDMTPRLVYDMARLYRDRMNSTPEAKTALTRVVRHYYSATKKQDPDSPIRALTLARLYLLKGQAYQIDPAFSMRVINPEDPVTKAYIDSIVSEDPAEGYIFAKFLKSKLGLDTTPPVEGVIDACLAGEWEALDRLERHDYVETGAANADGSAPEDESAMTAAQTRIISVLRALRRRRIHKAMEGISTMAQEGDPIPVRLNVAVISRAISVARWDLAIQGWLDLHSRKDTLKTLAEQVPIRESAKNILRHIRSALDPEESDGEAMSNALAATEQPAWTEFGDKIWALELDLAGSDEVERKREIRARYRTKERWKHVQECIVQAREHGAHQRAYG